MLKGLKIVFMLSLVVVIASVGVFFVESKTTPIIDERQRLEIQEAVKEVFPAIEGTTWSVEDSSKDFSGSPITGAKEIKDGSTLMGIVYTVQFRGFSSDITYVVGVDRGNNITGYKTISQNDTAGYGAQIADATNWEQFPGMLLDAAGSGAFDGLTGATVTTTGWKQSFADVTAWHNSNDVFPLIPQIDIDTALVRNKLGDETITLTELTDNQKATLAEKGIDVAYIATGDSGTFKIYIETYASYAPGTTVFLAVNADHETVKFEVLANADTPDWGGIILDSGRWSQLENQNLYYLIGGEFDDLGGATTTFTTWQDAMARISIFHQEVFQGIITYPLDTLEPVYQQQLSNITLGEFTAWTLNTNAGLEYTTTKATDGFAITYKYPDSGNGMNTVNLSQTGFDFTNGSQYRVLLEGYFGNARPINVTVDGTTVCTITFGDDTEGTLSARSCSFTSTADLTDAVVAINFGKYDPNTKNDTFVIADIKVEEYNGGVVADSDQVINGSLNLNGLVDVTNQKLGNINISSIHEVVSDLGTVEGYIYYGYTFGTFNNTPTLINFMLGIDKDGNYTGFRFLSTTDTTLVTSEIWTADYETFDETGYFAESIEGEASNASVSLDLVAGLEVQIRNIEDAINEIGRFHNEDYTKRYNESVADSKLALAIDNAVRFESIYNDFDFVQGVVNVYEAYDATDTLLGYVYAGRYDGREGLVSYVVGVSPSGQTLNVVVYEDSETWDQATFDGYDGSYGTDFTNSTWLELFEGKDVSAYVAGYTPAGVDQDNNVIGSSTVVDAVANVSTTTGGNDKYHGFVDSMYIVLKFHVDNSVGGAS